MKKMKKIILSCLCLFALTFNYGQGSSNLGFNQVLNYDYSVSRSGSHFHNVGTLTVGSNKVWKITSASAYFNEYGSPTIFYSTIKVGEHIVFSNYSEFQMFTPVWLPSGTYNVYLHCYSGNADNIYGSLSIVEFNIEN